MDIPAKAERSQPFSPELVGADPLPSIEQLESNIAELSAHIQAATYRLLCLVRSYDQLEGWATGGFVSCAHWLAWRTGDDLITAREKVRVARALEQLPLISAAFSVAKLSYSKVRAITRIAKPENEAELLVMGLEGTASPPGANRSRLPACSTTGAGRGSSPTRKPDLAILLQRTRHVGAASPTAARGWRAADQGLGGSVGCIEGESSLRG